MPNLKQGGIRKYPVSLRCAAEAVYGHRITADGEIFAPVMIPTQGWHDTNGQGLEPAARFLPT